MLNQRYTYNKSIDKMFCRIALGSNSEQCFVDPEFKCIVITNKYDAHTEGGIPIAFLNRFEKQLISYYSSLKRKAKSMCTKLHRKICEYYNMEISSDTQPLRNLFPGYNFDTLASLLINKDITIDETNEFDDDNGRNRESLIISQNNFDRLLDIMDDVALPQALIRSCMVDYDKSKRVIPTLKSIMTNNKFNYNDKLLIILTFDFESKLQNNMEWLNNNTIVKSMRDFSKAEQFESYIEYYLKSNQNKGLLLQYKHKYNTDKEEGNNSMNHFIHFKHIIESRIHKKGKDSNKRITILVHLRKTNIANVPSFPLIFSKNSKMVFLDSLSQQKPFYFESQD